VDGQPRLLNLKQMLEAFLRHRREVVTRRTLFELNKARERAHILEGLSIALANIDAIIALIKAAKDPNEAKAQLLEKTWQPGVVVQTDNSYRLSPIQAQAILDLRLHRLTSLEQDKILMEYQQQLDTIKDLLDILSNP